MPRREVEIVNKLGLHARASAKLTQLAAKYPCEVMIERNGRRVNAKSIMGVMMLAAGKGATVAPRPAASIITPMMLLAFTRRPLREMKTPHG
jgi:phosphotransferase system HPr (HPr) family protein